MTRLGYGLDGAAFCCSEMEVTHAVLYPQCLAQRVQLGVGKTMCSFLVLLSLRDLWVVEYDIWTWSLGFGIHEG